MPTDSCRYWLGMGYQQGISSVCLELAIQQLSAAAGLTMVNILGIATIAHKTNDLALQALCQRYAWRLVGFSAAQLARMTVPHPSSWLMTQIQTPSVAEAAALLAAGGVTARLYRDKQIIYSKGNGRAITLAIAKVAEEDNQFMIRM